VVTRIHSIPPRIGELFYVRILLHHRPAISFEDLRTIHGRVYATYQEAATALGLFEDELEAVRAVREAVAAYSRPGQLRFLFAHLLLDLRRLFGRSTRSSCCNAPRSSSRIASSYPGELLKSDNVELNCVTVDSPYRSVLARVVSSREGAKIASFQHEDPQSPDEAARGFRLRHEACLVCSSLPHQRNGMPRRC
jgi:hypothetical protein